MNYLVSLTRARSGTPLSVDPDEVMSVARGPEVSKTSHTHWGPEDHDVPTSILTFKDGHTLDVDGSVLSVKERLGVT